MMLKTRTFPVGASGFWLGPDLLVEVLVMAGEAFDGPEVRARAKDQIMARLPLYSKAMMERQLEFVDVKVRFYPRSETHRD